MGDGPDSETLDALPEVTVAVSSDPTARPRGAVVLVQPARPWSARPLHHRAWKADAMEALDLIRTLTARPAVRSFTDRPVPLEVLTQIIEIARWTGSARNRQPWRFIAVSDKEHLEKIGALGAYAQHLASAPCAVRPCSPLGRQRLSGHGVRSRQSQPNGHSRRDRLRARELPGNDLP